MIQEFVDRFMARKHELEWVFSQKHPKDYDEIVKAVVGIISGDDICCYEPDIDRIHKIDDGDYQGTLLFIIASKGYHPDNYWYVAIYYGSCSGCDTLEGIRCYDDDTPTAQQVADYMTLALHIVQKIKPLAISDSV